MTKESESKCSRKFFFSNTHEDREKTPRLPQPLAAISCTCEERNRKPFSAILKNSSCVRGLSVCIFVALCVLLEDISDLIRLSRMVQRTNFIVYEFCFTCFKVGYKRSYIFQSYSIETIIDI